uniref:Superkiller protein 3 n=1 Tax=Apis cerana TaxID=7461 RepID=V9IJS6_APICE
MIDKVLTRILLDNINKLDKYQDLLKNVFKSSITDFDAIEQQHFYRKYLKILYDKDELIILLKEAINMHQQFPQDIISLEYICRIYCEQNILGENFPDIDITQFYECLLKLNKESEIAAVTKAIYLKKIK